MINPSNGTQKLSLTMKRKDFIFLCVILAVFLPFALSPRLYEAYQSFNAAHGMVMSFLKFAVLSTLGELLGLRISSGNYLRRGFGVLPRALVWGVLGMGINLAFIVFSTGIPAVAGYLGVHNPAGIMAGPLCIEKVLMAFAISVAMNGRHAARAVLADTDGRHPATTELAGAMGLRVQKDHPAVLVPGAHSDFPVT